MNGVEIYMLQTAAAILESHGWEEECTAVRNVVEVEVRLGEHA